MLNLFAVHPFREQVLPKIFPDIGVAFLINMCCKLLTVDGFIVCLNTIQIALNMKYGMFSTTL